MCFLETPHNVLPFGVSGKQQSGMLDVFKRNNFKKTLNVVTSELVEEPP